MKKIMILGAGIYQLPLIRAAKQMGCETIVASIPGDYPGFAEADRVYYINTTDAEKLLEAAEAEGIHGICTTGTDVAVASIGYVNDRLGLSGISLQTARYVADKKSMQEMFHRGGVSSADFLPAVSAAEARQAAEHLGYPVVVKCVDSSGNRGINIVQDAGGIAQAFQAALQVSRQDFCIVERKLPGREFGIDGLVYKGRVCLIAPHQKLVCRRGNATVTVGHLFPFRGTDALQAEVCRQVHLAVDAMGLDNAAFNVDAFADGDAVHFIEIGGRAGATCIPELISCYYGMDYYTQILRLALGEEPSLPACGQVRKTSSGWGAHLIMSPADGMITGIDTAALQALSEDLPGLQVSLDYSLGHAVTAFANGTHRIGQIIAPAEEESALRQILRSVGACIEINGSKLVALWDEAGIFSPQIRQN